MHMFNDICFRVVAAGLLFFVCIPYGALAQNDTRDVVRDARGNVVTTILSGSCVRTKWEVGHDPCAPVPVRASLTKEDRTVYFAFNKAEILPSEQRKLDSLANFLRSDVQIQDARIVGYADRLGSAAYNKKLSEFRAKAVENYLHTHGYLNTRMAQVRWLGESAPVTHCSNTMKRNELIACLQKDRRVEVEIDYFPQTASPPQ